MKVALKQSAMPSDPTANQDFTDSQFSSDVKLMIPFFSRATANNTITEEQALSFGATDGTTEAAICQISQDNVGTQLSKVWSSSTRTAILGEIAGGATLDAEADGSLLSNGGRLAWQSWAANELINALLIGGSDVAVKVHNLAFDGGTPSTATVTHGLGATPDIVIAFTTGHASSNTKNCLSVGFYDRVGGTYACMGYAAGIANPTQYLAAIYNTAICTDVTTGGVQWTATVTTLNSTTLTLTLGGSAPDAVTDVVKVICLKVTGGAYKVGTFTCKTSTTGTQNDITGMSLAPQMVMYLGSKIGTINTSNSANDGEGMSIGVAVNNNGSTEQCVSAVWGDDNVTLGVTDNKSYTSNTKAGMNFDDTGGKAYEWEISSWNSDGITNNYTTVWTENHIVAYLAIGGIQVSSPTATMGRCIYILP